MNFTVLDSKGFGLVYVGDEKGWQVLDCFGSKRYFGMERVVFQMYTKGAFVISVYLLPYVWKPK